ncbi:hypothetical protein QWY86_11600 [Pedobacter aquatilis]|uniref:DUF7033 domain-containing protein n=1 Tax=Pedobacter aquatilis TaxID=351343 RepID=UPI0025B4E4BA|nr:hypothetical protein [Pedobacter aquatilis]MDN3587317.1 hypothetical protein [Pedobacter aquatilis]
MHVIVFSPVLTPRIKYIFTFIFKDILKTELEFTGNKEYFLQSDLAKISYADKPLGNELFFKNSSLLLSNKVEELKLKSIQFDDYKVPFPVDDSPFPFDVFAASFFILSRYEEYIHKEKSSSTFKAEKSYQHKWKLLNRPIIDEWALMIKNLVRKKYPSIKFLEKKFTHQPTINFTLKSDVPEGFIPKTKFIFSSVFNKEQKYLSSVFDDITGLNVNPDITIESLTSINLNQKPIYFVNFPADSKNRLKFEKSSSFLRDKATGLFRPCTSDKEKSASLKIDLLKLSKIQNSTINLLSQQTEDLRLPSCYLNLLSAGISSDFSMGYEDTPGFRAGTCTPFNWYDLQLEKVTPIIVNSYSLCDSAIQYLNLNDAIKIVHTFIDVVKVVNGQFYSSWKLKNLSENVKFKKYRTVYIEMIKYAGN